MELGVLGGAEMHLLVAVTLLTRTLSAPRTQVRVAIEYSLNGEWICGLRRASAPIKSLQTPGHYLQ